MVRIDDTALDEIEKDSRQCIAPGMGDVQLMVAEIRQLKAENKGLRQENKMLREGRTVHLKAFYMFPEKLLQIRLEKGLTQRQLADLTGLSCPLISNYETGVTRPRMKNVLRLENALDCPGAFQGVKDEQ